MKPDGLLPPLQAGVKAAATKGVLVFDMDGVLVDVTESYRETIRRTVAHFTGKGITRELIQDYKNAGGWNNDWALSRKIILDLGIEVEYQIVVDHFQSIFFGNGSDGMILREKWIANGGLIERLQEQYRLAIFTGRTLAEAEVTLHRFARDLRFDMVVADDPVRPPKPAPDGLLEIARRFPAEPMWYVGDTVDDARSARAAGVSFIGVAHAANPRRDELVALLRAEGAIAVLENVNEVESCL
ncbi:MAG: HAD-IA family hydrolase [Acidobacteria bacterium]|nr:HAD-IA family hydrolase [Acidobacteriota bacterium]